MKLAVLFFMMSFIASTHAQDNFKVPSKLDVLPVTYLENMQVKAVDRVLTEGERHDICRLFVAMHLITKRKYGQDYLLEPNAPIYMLFKKISLLYQKTKERAEYF